MPCRDPRDTVSWSDVERANETTVRLQRRNDVLIRAICDIDKKLRLTDQQMSTLNPSTVRVIKEHRAFDKARKK